MVWWCVKLLNWRHLRHTLFSGVCRGNLQDIFWSTFARAERWGIPVIWAPKKDISQGCAFDSKTFMIFGSQTTSKLWLKELWDVGLLCLLAVWLKSSIQHFRTERKISNRNLLTKLAVLFPLEKSVDFMAIWGNTIATVQHARLPMHLSLHLLFATRFHRASVCSQTWEILPTMDAQPDIPMLNVTPDIVQSHVCFRIELQPLFTGNSGII